MDESLDNQSVLVDANNREELEIFIFGGVFTEEECIYEHAARQAFLRTVELLYAGKKLMKL